MRIQTLQINEKVKSFGHLGLVTEEPVLEVDFMMTGYIHEIRVHSEYFGDFVPVTESWLKNNFPAKLETIRNAVEVAIMDATVLKPKTYINDDPNPAA